MSTLVARLDNLGDVLLAGPAVRAVAAGTGDVTLLVGPRGRAAADLLPGVGAVMQWCAPWIDPEPAPLSREYADELMDGVRAAGIQAALILTSFHQSPLPLATLLRMAGVPWIGAVCDDYPGSLLDLRHRVAGDPPEAERMLSLATAAGYRLPPGDDGRLAVRGPLPAVTDLTGPPDYIVVHPGVSAPARGWPATRWAELVRDLSATGFPVVVTGSATERSLTCQVVGDTGALDLGGRTDLRALASVIARARAIVVANTGAAHLAAAVGTPVVSLFAPVVPAARWAPYRVPTVVLGDQHASCAGTRARHCPVPGHPCLNNISTEAVIDGLHTLTTPFARGGRACVPDPAST
jgi:ADP-heptose:LPS heptosyltransferase